MTTGDPLLREPLIAPAKHIRGLAAYIDGRRAQAVKSCIQVYELG